MNIRKTNRAAQPRKGEKCSYDQKGLEQSQPINLGEIDRILQVA